MAVHERPMGRVVPRVVRTSHISANDRDYGRRAEDRDRDPSTIPSLGDPTMVRSARRAFTLVELLVVVVIVLMVSALVLPTIVTSYREQHVVSAAAQVQAAVVAARDLAARTGRPAGFRLLPDEAFALARLADGTIDVTLQIASNSWVPIDTPPRYAEGLVSIYPYSAASPYPLPLPSPVLV